MINKKHSKTKMVSLRLDEDVYNAFKFKNLNLSLAVNTLLRGYLYIQKRDDTCPAFGSSRYNPKDLRIDCYLISKQL